MIRLISIALLVCASAAAQCTFTYNPRTKQFDCSGGAAGPPGPAGAGVTTINTLTALTQTFVPGTSGTDFNISSSGSTHTFNCPTASSTIRGCISTADWTIFNGKQAALGFTPFNPANNFSEVVNAATARTNLGAQAALGFTPFNPANNLSEIVNAATARSNLGLVIGTHVIAPNSAASLASLTLSGNLTRTGQADGCATWATGVLGSTGTPCGAGSGGEANTTADAGAGAFSWRATTPKTGVALNLRTFSVTAPFAAAVSTDVITFSMPAAATGQSGHLSSVDWNTFNNKFPKPASGTGVIKWDGSTSSVITGTGSDCIRVDTTSGPCGSGGGGSTSPAYTVALTGSLQTILFTTHNVTGPARVSFYAFNSVRSRWEQWTAPADVDPTDTTPDVFLPVFTADATYTLARAVIGSLNAGTANAYTVSLTGSLQTVLSTTHNVPGPARVFFYYFNATRSRWEQWGSAADIDPTDATPDVFLPVFTADATYTQARAVIASLSASATTGGSGDMLKSDNLSGLANYGTARTNLGLQIGLNVQGWDADLDTWATKTPPTGTVMGTSDTQSPTNKSFNETNQFTSYFDVTAVAAPSAPAAGKVRLYAKTSVNQICSKDSAGSELCLSGGGGHTQNTDTGTTQTSFQIDSGGTGPRWKNVSGVMTARNAADSAYADVVALSFQTPSGTAFSIEGGTSSAPATPSAGVVKGWFDSASKALKTINDAAALSTTVFTSASRTANQFCTHVSTAGVCVPAAIVKADQPATTVSNDQANTFGAFKQTFTPSATVAGAQLVCAALPSSPANGDLACDSGDSNKVKVRTNGAWVEVVAGITTLNGAPGDVGTSQIEADAVTRDKVSAILRTRQVYIPWNAIDNTTLHTTNDDQVLVWKNGHGSGITITKVACRTAAGTASFNLLRDDGSAANILSSALACSTTDASTTTFSGTEYQIADGHYLNLDITAVSSSKFLGITITYTVD